MPVKKCQYCGYRMTKIVYGMPTPEDHEKSNEFLAFAGCIIEYPAKAYECSKCQASLLAEFSPRSGACLHELPPRQREAIEVFAERVARAMNPLDPSSVFQQCRLDDHESFDYGKLIQEHTSLGDEFVISRCSCTELVVPLGSNLATLRHTTVCEDSPWDVEDRIYEAEVELPRSVADADIVELVVGTKMLYPMVEALATMGCDRDFCSGDPRYGVDSMLNLEGSKPYEDEDRLAYRARELRIPADSIEGEED